MKWLFSLGYRLSTLTRRRRHQADLSREVRFHLEERTRELQAQGLAAAEAERAARREFGAADVFEEACRDAWGLRWWHDFRRDAALAIRRMRQQKGYVAVITLTFALCVSLNTFMLGLTDALLLNPGLYPEEDRLVFLWEGDNTFASNHDRGNMPLALEADIREGAPALAQYSPYNYSLSHVGWVPEEARTDLVESFRVGADYFETLRVSPVLGRAFAAADVRGSGARVAILTDSAWRRHFNRDPMVLGRSIRVDSVRHEVVGVMPRDFVPAPESTLTRDGDFGVLLPFSDADKEAFVAQFFPFAGVNAVGRLASGASAEQAVQQIDALKTRLHPERYAGDRADLNGTRARPLGSELTRSWVDKLVLLQGASLLIMVLGCVNIAGLISGRNLGRLRELAVRAALGAGKSRLVAQLVTESLILSLLGGILGFGLAIAEQEIARAAGMFDALAIDPQLARRPMMLLASVGLAAAAGALAGVMALWPLLRRDDLDMYLKQDARTGTTGRAATAWRDGLVTAQVALAVTLLVASGLLAKSFGRMLEVDLGFNSERLLTAWIKLPESRFDVDGKRDFMVRLDRELQTMPGLEAATLANQPPMNVTGGPGFVIEGLEPAENMPWPRCNLFTVGLGFGETLGISVQRGRGFAASDMEPGAPNVILVDQLLVDRHLGSEEPIGQRVHLNGRWWTVIGVAETVHYQDVTNPLRQPTIYQNYAQRPPWWFVAILRTSGEPARMIEPLRAAISRVDPEIGAFNFETMDEMVTRSYADRTTLLSLSGVFTGVALLLVVLGIYGSVAQSVAARTREIGVRMALGANPGRVVTEVLRGGMTRFGVGAAVGLAGAVAVARLITAQLYATSPYDGGVYLIVLLVLAAAVAAACVGPARRAARVDPLVALRAE